MAHTNIVKLNIVSVESLLVAQLAQKSISMTVQYYWLSWQKVFAI